VRTGADHEYGRLALSARVQTPADLYIASSRAADEEKGPESIAGGGGEDGGAGPVMAVSSSAKRRRRRARPPGRPGPARQDPVARPTSPKYRQLDAGLEGQM